jgi:murein L,D-transpeptidase YcbB/YkuD
MVYIKENLMQLWKIHISRCLWKFISISLGFFFICLTGSPALPESLTDIIHLRIDTLRTYKELTIGETKIASTKMLAPLYEKNQFNPFWTDANKIDALIRSIKEIKADGLEPEDYHYSEISGLQAFLEHNDPKNNLNKADLDMLLTDALILLKYHLVFGKVDPKRLNSTWNFHQKMDSRDPIAAVEEFLASKDLFSRINELKPQRPIYAKLKSALAHYFSILAAGGWQSVPTGVSLKKGMHDDSVLSLRKRLAVSGDLSTSNVNDDHFDADLEKVIVQFQKQHGLTPDGVVGRKTITALNVPVTKRIDQIRANLERARWSLHALKDRFVLVDMAGSEIFFYDNDNIIWKSRVQVGRSFCLTPVFRDNIRYLEFNPAWTIPIMIFNKTILPEIKKDPQYLAKHQINIFDQRKRIVVPESLEWDDYPEKKFLYILRQAPGPNNALGLVKFMFPNDDMIYLSDTPVKNLFSMDHKTFSTGCIRVEKPFELAELLLNDSSRWHQNKFKQIIASQKTQIAYLKDPVPVLLLYWTVDVDNSGIVYFKEDIYNRDKAVIKGLKTGLTPTDKSSYGKK